MDTRLEVMLSILVFFILRRQALSEMIELLLELNETLGWSVDKNQIVVDLARLIDHDIRRGKTKLNPQLVNIGGLLDELESVSGCIITQA